MGVPDFAGYVTKFGIRCSDGRTILAHAFKGSDGQKVPLVWQHQHNSPENVLGHVILHQRDDGVWGEGFFNPTVTGTQGKALVQAGDISSLSIYANQLIEQAKNVVHGVIREVSLVMAGANPGAHIDPVSIMHGGEETELADEAIIYPGTELELSHAGSTTVDPPQKVVPAKGAMPKPSASNPDPDKDGDNDLFDPKDGGLDAANATVQQVLDTMTDEQKNVVYGLVGAAMEQSGSEGGEGAGGTDDDPDNTINHDQEGGTPVGRNVFDQSDPATTKVRGGTTLSHSDLQEVFKLGQKAGSLKEGVEAYAMAHGIEDISTLFPYDQAVTTTPEFISRRMEWVNGVLGGVRKTPFSRIRSWTADLTLDQARAKGYVKANLKKEEYFRVARRITTPQTIYKKQKLDRDDILDITDFDVVTWLQTEMRVMLDEELARAILIGDGRDIDDPDKISPTNVRPILGDDDLYVTTLNVDLTDALGGPGNTASSADEIVDAVVTGMQYYRGSGNPVMYTTLPYLSKMLLAKDSLGRRLYPTRVELAAALGVSAVIPCEVLQESANLIGIIVNLLDYTIGADKGGEVTMFDFFDIDYNQFKYLMETRVSGAMTKYKGALVVQEFAGAGGMLPNPTAPTFVTSTGVATIPTTSHVTYAIVDDTDGSVGSALTAGAQTAIDPGTSVHIRALAASTYSFVDSEHEDWTFTRDSA
jgi:HK97 family phage prohead protease